MVFIRNGIGKTLGILTLITDHKTDKALLIEPLRKGAVAHSRSVVEGLRDGISHRGSLRIHKVRAGRRQGSDRLELGEVSVIEFTCLGGRADSDVWADSVDGSEAVNADSLDALRPPSEQLSLIVVARDRAVAHTHVGTEPVRGISTVSVAGGMGCAVNVRGNDTNFVRVTGIPDRWRRIPASIRNNAPRHVREDSRVQTVIRVLQLVNIHYGRVQCHLSLVVVV